MQVHEFFGLGNRSPSKHSSHGHDVSIGAPRDPHEFGLELRSAATPDW